MLLVRKILLKYLPNQQSCSPQIGIGETPMQKFRIRGGGEGVRAISMVNCSIPALHLDSQFE